MNYLLGIQYDGTNYSGWQIQKNSSTIQQIIVDAISIITKEQVNLIGSGRTDAGVHALGQCANFILNKQLNLEKFKYQLNSIIPNDISITSIQQVPEEFNARFDAVKREYVYIISRSKNVFLEKYSYFYGYEINIKKLNYLSNIFLGENNYASFCKKKSEVENTNCYIYSIGWKQMKDTVYFSISANRFLHGMVRTIVGTLLLAEKEEKDLNFINLIFEKKDRRSAGEAVPAKGLFLKKVSYNYAKF